MKKTKRLYVLLLCVLFALTAVAAASFAFAADDAEPAEPAVDEGVTITKIETETFTETVTTTTPAATEGEEPTVTTEEKTNTKIRLTFNLPEGEYTDADPAPKMNDNKNKMSKKLYYNYTVGTTKTSAPNQTIGDESIHNVNMFNGWKMVNKNTLEFKFAKPAEIAVNDYFTFIKDLPLIKVEGITAKLTHTQKWQKTAEGWVNLTAQQKKTEQKLKLVLQNEAKNTATAGGGFGVEFLKFADAETGTLVVLDYNDSEWGNHPEIKEYIQYKGADGSTSLPGWFRYASAVRLGNDDTHKFVNGDEITFLEGLHFNRGGGGWPGSTAYKEMVYNGYLTESITLKCTGTGWIVKEVGPMKPGSVGAIQENTATASLPATYEISVRFTNVVSEAEAAKLEENDAYATKIKIGGKTVKQLNEEITGLVNDDDEPVKAVYLSAYSTDIKVTVVKASGIWDGEATLQLDILSGLVAESENYTDADATYYYLPKLAYWSTVAPDETVKTEAVNITSVSAHEVIDNGANGNITVLFDKPIVNSDYLWYNCMPDYRKTLPAPYVPERTDEIVSASAYESFISHIEINGKTIAELYAGEGSPESKSSVYQCHIGAAVGGKDRIAIRSAVSNGWGGDEAITITIKKGLVFESGVYLDYDINIVYTPASGETEASTVYTVATDSITAEIENVTAGSDGKYALTVGGEYNLIANVLPAASTDEVSYSVSEGGVVTLADGVITAVKSGEAAVTVSAGGKSATVNITVKAAEKPKYTVTFNLNYTGSPAAATAQVTEGESATAPAAPTRSGYTFGGWYKEAACTNEWNFASDKVNAATTLYAKWTENANGGNTNKPEEKKGCGSSAAASCAAAAAVMFALGGAAVLARRKHA